MGEVESESKHVWGLLKDIFLLPLTLILVLFRRKEFNELLNPLKDVWNFFWDAKVIAVLILLNIAVFGFFVVDDLTGNKITGIHSQEEFDVFGEKYLAVGPKNVRSGNLIPFFVSWFMHAGIAHLLGNMLALFILGRVVEKNFGALKTLLIYIMSAAIANAADVAVHFNQMDYFAVGASGAIAGLASAAMLAQPFYLTYLFAGIPLPVFLVAWLFLWSDISGVLNPDPASNIAHFAHLGGFFAIMVIAFFLSSEDKSKLKKGLLMNIITLAVFGAIWFFLIKGAV